MPQSILFADRIGPVAHAFRVFGFLHFLQQGGILVKHVGHLPRLGSGVLLRDGQSLLVLSFRLGVFLLRTQGRGQPQEPGCKIGTFSACDLLNNRQGPFCEATKRSLPIVEKVAGAESSDLTPRLLGLATALRAQKKYAEAEAQYKRALAITQKNAGPEAWQVADVLDQYATLLEEMKKPEDAKGMRDWADSVRKQDALRHE